MPHNDPICNRERKDICDYFHRQVKKPRFVGWLDGSKKEVDLKYVKFDAGAWIGRQWALRRAAWLWLRPDPPARKLEDLAPLKERCGYKETTDGKFAKDLGDACKELLRDHKPLTLWGRRRTGLLEFFSAPPLLVPTKFSELLFGLEATRIEAQSYLQEGNYREASRAATAAVQAALIGTMNATQHYLDSSNTMSGRCSATLMLEVDAGDAKQWSTIIGDDAIENQEAAARLWSGFPTSKVLMVFGETPGCRHCGFWVPADSLAGNTLPGAPTAAKNGMAFSIFKDDLPDMTPFGHVLSDRWKQYMQAQFKDNLFVSLPILGAGSDGIKVVTGVVNVNAVSFEPSSWSRAYHPDWLDVTRSAISPFAFAAWYAKVICVACLAGPSRSLKLDRHAEAVLALLRQPPTGSP